MPARRQKHKETALLKMLAYVLGVAPYEFGLLPDAGGWLPIKELVKALSDTPDLRFVRASMVLEAATRLAPEILESDGRLVRARQRRPLERDYTADPPGHLYYGARRRAWPVMRDKGIKTPQSGVLVLVADPQEALKLGRRRDHEALLITVQATKALEKGVPFSFLGERLWLCDWLPADCLLGPLLPEDQAQKKSLKSKPVAPPPGFPSLPSPEAMPGSFLLNTEDSQKPYKRKGIKKNIEWKRGRRKNQRKGER
ncbi:RNA 2'-phosphotransferase [Desulfarculales bacterium]